MKSQLSSLDIHFLLQELQFLTGSRVDKIYNPAKKELLIQLHIPGKGKQMLRLLAGKIFYLTEFKDDQSEPSSFCMFLRKHIGNSRLVSIIQKESERIIELCFDTKEGIKKLMAEFFAKGNFVFCNSSDVILSAEEYVSFKDRKIRPKEKYLYPHMACNFFSFSKKELSSLFRNSSKDSIVKCLAVELGLGGVFSEEVCLMASVDMSEIAKSAHSMVSTKSNQAISEHAQKHAPYFSTGRVFDKTKKPFELDNGEIEAIQKSIGQIIHTPINASIAYDKEAADVIPFPLQYYRDFRLEPFPSLNNAFDYYFTKEYKESRKSPSDRQREKLLRLIQHQEEQIKAFELEASENTQKAELIYSNYTLLDSILKELQKATAKYSWKEIKDKLKGHKVVKEVDAKDKKVSVEV